MTKEQSDDRIRQIRQIALVVLVTVGTSTAMIWTIENVHPVGFLLALPGFIALSYLEAIFNE